MAAPCELAGSGGCVVMTASFSTCVTNKIDAKGRVSIPAAMRAVLLAQGTQEFACFASFMTPAIEGYTREGAEALAKKIQAMPMYSPARLVFERAVLARMHMLSFDGEGRLVLPQQLVEHAKLSDAATFVGCGNRFEIWNPDLYTAEQDKAVAEAAKLVHLLDSQAPFGNGGGQ